MDFQTPLLSHSLQERKSGPFGETCRGEGGDRGSLRTHAATKEVQIDTDNIRFHKPMIVWLR